MKLTSQQNLALSKDGPILVLAGWAGKTTMLWKD